MTSLVFRDVEIEGVRSDVVVRDGVVVAVGPRLDRPEGAEAIDGAGAALIPGLHDHHLHLAAMAADRASVKVGRRWVRDASSMGAALRVAADAGRSGHWVRATRYHEQVAGELDRHALDAMVGDRPVRVQHQTGAMWVLSSAAVRAARLDDADHPGVERASDGTATGRVFGADGWLRDRVPASGPLDLASVGSDLARFGITGVTDATPITDPDGFGLLAAAVATGDLPVTVTVTGGPALAEEMPPAPLMRGPVKVVVTDHALPSVDELASAIGRAHAAGRAVAVHCVTHIATVLALTAWAEAGPRPGDRIEHGSVITADTAALIAERRLTVVTQPSFLFTRGDDYLRDVEAIDQPHLYRCATLEAAGVAVAGSTDAPYGDPDPWLAMASAVDRATRAGQVIGPDEAVTPERALALFLGAADAPGGPPRRVTPGAPADLCLLRVPLADAIADFDSAQVRMTFVAGRCTYPRDAPDVVSPSEPDR